MRFLFCFAAALAFACGGSKAAGDAGGKADGSGGAPPQGGTGTGVAHDSVSVAISGAGRVVSIPAGIDCTDHCNAAFERGAHLTLTAVPAEGSTFAGWTGACAGLGACEIDVRSDAQASAAFVARPARFVVSEIPAMDGMTGLYPRGINARGDVVGSVGVDSHGGTNAFLYDAASNTTQRLRADGTLSQMATAIDLTRHVVGWVVVNNLQTWHAVMWTDGAVTNLPVASGTDGTPVNSAALAINAHGAIAGWSGGRTATVWDASAARILGTGTDLGSVANAISGAGVSAGFTWAQIGLGESHAAVFKPEGIQLIGSLANMENSVANAINDAGRVVGTAFSSLQFGEYRAFVYDLPSGPMRDVAPDRRCNLKAVNAAGVAVGYCVTGSPGALVSRAAILGGDLLKDLNDVVADPDWVLTGAAAINDSGQIAGTGLHRGEPRAYVLTPP